MIVVTALDHFFTYAALRAEVLQERYSWRLGQWLRNRVTSTHEDLLRVCLRRGWSIVDANLVQAAQAVCPQAVPPYPVFFVSSDKSALWMSKLRAGIYVREDGTEVPLDTLSWHQNPFAGTFSVARLFFDSLGWVKEL